MELWHTYNLVPTLEGLSYNTAFRLDLYNITSTIEELFSAIYRLPIFYC